MQRDTLWSDYAIFLLYRNGAATNFATKQSEDEKADSNGQNCVKEGANDE